MRQHHLLRRQVLLRVACTLRKARRIVTVLESNIVRLHNTPHPLSAPCLLWQPRAHRQMIFPGFWGRMDTMWQCHNGQSNVCCMKGLLAGATSSSTSKLQVRDRRVMTQMAVQGARLCILHEALGGSLRELVVAARQRIRDVLLQVGGDKMVREHVLAVALLRHLVRHLVLQPCLLSLRQ